MVEVAPRRTEQKSILTRGLMDLGTLFGLAGFVVAMVSLV
jgi:hypothetical protein